jgi:hypothetical protein
MAVWYDDLGERMIHAKHIAVGLLFCLACCARVGFELDGAVTSAEWGPLADASPVDAAIERPALLDQKHPPADVGQVPDHPAPDLEAADTAVPDVTSVVTCPCFDNLKLKAIQAHGGNQTCVVDNVGGGTTITALISSKQTATDKYRFVASALYNASLPGTSLACEYGCIDDTPGNTTEECKVAGLPLFQQQKNISVAEHVACRALIIPYYTP